MGSIKVIPSFYKLSEAGQYQNKNNNGGCAA